MKYAKNDETKPKYVGYVEDIQQEMKITERTEFQKLTQNRLVYDKLSPNLEPNVNNVQLS
jgi:hypothetical protein